MGTAWNDISVPLSSSSANVTVPSTITVHQASDAASFAIQTVPVAASETDTISATLGNQTAQRSITLYPYPISSMYISPKEVMAGTPAYGVLHLNSPAPPCGIVVPLVSAPSGAAGPFAEIPPVVKIPGGASGVSFKIQTTAVPYSVIAEVVANSGNSQIAASFTIDQGPISDFSVTPSSIYGGSSGQGSVTLTQPASTGGATVTLKSGTSYVTMPPSVTIPQGQQTVAFPVTTAPVLASARLGLLATLDTTTVPTFVTLLPNPFSNFYISPSTVTGGQTTSGVLQTPTKAGPGGVVASLTSHFSTVVVPGSVTIPAGKTGISFPISTAVVSATQIVTVDARVYPFDPSAPVLHATITLNPCPIAGFYAYPSTVDGGMATRGVIQLSGRAGPSGNLIDLKSSDSSVIVPLHVKIPATSTGISFAISTKPVSSSVNVQLTATEGHSVMSTTLTVNAGTIAAFFVSPSGIFGGDSSQGTVQLNAPAGPGGTEVSLKAGSSYLSTPATATVPEGQTQVTFTVSSMAVTRVSPLTLLVTLGADTVQTTLTLYPPQISNFYTSPSTVKGGASATGVVQIPVPAGSGGVTISISSADSNVSVPSSVTISAGSTGVSFQITTKSVGASTPVTLTASWNGASKQTTITLTP